MNTVCICMGDGKPGTKQCSRIADSERSDGLCKLCGLPDSYCREFRAAIDAQDFELALVIRDRDKLRRASDGWQPTMDQVMAAMRAFDIAEHTDHAKFPASWVSTFSEMLVAAHKAALSHDPVLGYEALPDLAVAHDEAD